MERCRDCDHGAASCRQISGPFTCDAVKTEDQSQCTRNSRLAVGISAQWIGLWTVPCQVKAKQSFHQRFVVLEAEFGMAASVWLATSSTNERLYRLYPPISRAAGHLVPSGCVKRRCSPPEDLQCCLRWIIQEEMKFSTIFTTPRVPFPRGHFGAFGKQETSWHCPFQVPATGAAEASPRLASVCAR